MEEKIIEYQRTLEWIARQYKLPEKFNKEEIDEFLSKLSSLESIWGLCGRDLTKLDLSEFDEVFLRKLAFNEDTIFPNDFHLDYQKIMDEGKHPGLDIDRLHDQGINGTRVNIAIIDKPILENHNDLEIILRNIF